MYRVILGSKVFLNEALAKLKSKFCVSDELEIEQINIDVYHDDKIAASKSLSRRKCDKNGKILPLDFQEFKRRVIELISYYGFVILEEPKQSSSSNSYYLIAYKPPRLFSGAIEKVFVFRISDHPVHHGKHGINTQRNYFQKEIDSGKFGDVLELEIVYITIDDKNFSSYESALESVKDILRRV